MDFFHVMTIRLDIAEQILSTKDKKNTVLVATSTGLVISPVESPIIDEVTPNKKVAIVVKSR